ncbi:MAG: TonB-dependent receptor [Bacteroidota bacterium]
MRKFFTAWIILGFSISVSYAQKGVLSGTIIDATGPLPGAAVYLKNSTLGNITDRDGHFVIGNLPEGSQTFVISFIGYETLEKQVEITGGSNDLGTLSLSEASTQLEEVVVTSTLRQGQMKALNIQKTSPNIMSVLASDAIGKLPDRNAAEAVQRISGVAIERDQGEGRFVLVRGTPIQWSSTLINGDRMPSTRSGDRGVPLDIFPSELIQYVQLSKAITPDMEGDAIGGSVNFITRTSPQERMLNASFAGGYHGQSTSRIINGSIIYGDRALNDKLGYIFSAATWNRDWGSDNYEAVYNTSQEEKFAMNELQLRDYVGNRTTWGFNGGVDYEFNPESKIFLKGIWTDFLDDEERRRTRFRFDRERIEHALTHTQYHSRFRGAELGGEQKLADRLKVDWKVSSYATRFWYDSPNKTGKSRPGLFDGAPPQTSEDLGYYFSTFRQDNVSFDGLSSDGNKYFAFDSPDGVGVLDDQNIQPNISASTPMTTESARLISAVASGRWIKERDVTGKLDFTYEASNQVKLKFGGKYRSKDRLANRVVTSYLPSGDVFMNDLASEAFPTNGGFLTEIGNVYEDLLVPYPTLDANDNIPDLPGIQRELQPFNGPDLADESYTATENISAFYGMTEWQLNTKWMILGGARYENTDIDYDSYSVDENDNVSPINAKRSFGAFLPMAHLKYSPSKNTNLRLAVTRTFARPDFVSLSPSRSLDFGENVGSIGNPDLQPTFSWNFDLLGERYFDNVGVIAAGVFYKDITDAIFSSNTQTVIQGMNFNVSTPLNASDAYLVGFEVGLVRRLDFLPGFASGLGVDINYTFTDSEVQVPGRDEKQQLFGQSKNIWNATLFYEKYGLMVRLAANFKGSYLDELQGDGPDQDRFYDKNLNLDFSAAYSISPKVRAFIEMNNLLNEPLRYYHGVVNRPEQVEWYSIRGQAGVTLSLF